MNYVRQQDKPFRMIGGSHEDQKGGSMVRISIVCVIWFVVCVTLPVLAQVPAAKAPVPLATDVTTTGGTAGYLPIFNGASTIVNSLVSQSGTTLDVGGTVNAATSFDLGGEAFALGSFGNRNAFLGFAGNTTMTGTYNAASGYGALFWNTTGTANTAVGAIALGSNTTGSDNTASGTAALELNTTGSYNTATGYNALARNTSASYNSAMGAYALAYNTTGHNSSAFGYAALYNNTTGIQNDAFGDAALAFNTTGNGNAAFGTAALEKNTTGGSSSETGANSAFGNFALSANTTAGGNSAFGYSALTAVTTGANNTAVGSAGLAKLTTGNGNIAIGVGAGGNLDGAESNDIYIGNSGEAGERNTIRIGYIGTITAAAIAGIWGNTSASGLDVLVNESGLLGTTTSSRRFKHQIADMGEESDVLMKLRPVTFYYKPELDKTQTRQYGLVAEEVAEVAPQLVAFDKDGTPQAVRYHFVNAMLLNEVQKQRQLIEEQQKTNEEQNSTIARQQDEIQDLAARLGKLETVLAAKP
jgi:hypothetical protein